MTVVIYDVASDSGVRCNNILELAHGLRHFQPERWMSLNKFYAVSDWGRVKQTQKNRLLKQYRNGNGYACVRFTGDKYNSPVHKLVLPKFRPRIDYSPDAKKSYPFIDHINHNRMDACLGNLRYSNNALNQMNRRSVNGYYEKKKRVCPQADIVLLFGCIKKTQVWALLEVQKKQEKDIVKRLETLLKFWSTDGLMSQSCYFFLYFSRRYLKLAA